MANVLELYEEQMKSLNIQERLSLELEWDKKRSDIYKEYIEHKGSKNIIQEFMKGMMDTEYCDESGKITTLAEKMIKEAIMNESGKMDFKKLETLQKLLGGIPKEVKVSGGLELSAKAKELSK